MSSSPVDRRCALVLDIGGVILSDALDPFFKGNPALKEAYREDMRETLTRAPNGEAEFFRWLQRKTGTRETEEQLRQRFLQNMQPLPAADALPRWAQQVHLSILSNHVGTLVRERLKDLGLLQFFGKISISSETGYLKPDPAAFIHAFVGLPPGRIVYADDKEQNVNVARSAGATVGIIAEGDWVERVDRTLEQLSGRRFSEPGWELFRP